MMHMMRTQMGGRGHGRWMHTLGHIHKARMGARPGALARVQLVAGVADTVAGRVPVVVLATTTTTAAGTSSTKQALVIRVEQLDAYHITTTNTISD